MLALWPWHVFISFFELNYPPDLWYRITLVAFGLTNFILSMLIEYYIVDHLLFRRLRYRFHNIEKSRRKFLSIENHLRQTPTWPPISPMFGADGSGGSAGGGTCSGLNSVSTPTSPVATISEADHQSPKSFTEICVESDELALNNCNSVLKGFFDHLESESDDSDDSEDSDLETREMVHTPPIATFDQSPSLRSKAHSSSNESSLFVPINNGHSMTPPPPEPQDEPTAVTTTVLDTTGKSYTNHIQSNHCDSLSNNNNNNNSNNHNATQINQILASSNS